MPLRASGMWETPGAIDVLAVMHPHLQNIAIIAYVCAMGLALAHLVQRQTLVHRLAVLATLVGWIAHTLPLVVLAIEIGGPPLGHLPKALSVVVWVVVLLG